MLELPVAEPEVDGLPRDELVDESVRVDPVRVDDPVEPVEPLAPIDEPLEPVEPVEEPLEPVEAPEEVGDDCEVD